jgi:DNA-binding NarL/FixJ family response regulator
MDRNHTAREHLGDHRPAPTRVLVAGGKSLFREALTLYLRRQARIDVVAVVDSGQDAVRAAGEENPDVVVIDMPDGSEGLRTAHTLKASAPAMGIVVLLPNGAKDKAPVMRGGAQPGWTVLSKKDIRDGATLMRAVEGAAWGLVSEAPANTAHERLRGGKLLERLTQDQQAALRHMAAACNDDAIADNLGLRPAEAARLVASVYDDLHVPRDPAVDRRVMAVLVYLRETASLRY